VDASGAIQVTSTPAGAAIALGDSTTGFVTDALLSDLEAGSYVVRISLGGYESEPDSIVVTVSDGDTASAAFTLSVIVDTGTIAVLSEPAGAEIILDGSTTGAFTPDTLTGVPVGEHTVTLSLDDHYIYPDSVLVTVALDSMSEAPFTLYPIPQKVVLVEHFSNNSCIPCKDVEENLVLAVGVLGHTKVVSMANHLNFPGPTDVFFLANPMQMIERGQKFGVNSLPALFVDGIRFSDPQEYDALLDTVQGAGAIDAAYDIDVAAAVQGDSFVVSGTVRKLAETAGDEILTVVIIETDISYDAENDVTHFDDIVRKYMPGTSGESISLDIGGETTYRHAEAVSGSWNAANLEAIVFVSSAGNRYVYQASSTQ